MPVLDPRLSTSLSPVLLSLASVMARHCLPHMCATAFRICTCQGQLFTFPCQAFFPSCGVSVVSRIQRERLSVAP